MARPVALGAAGGSFSTLLFSLLRESFVHHHPIIHQVPRVECECPAFSNLLEQIDNPGLVLFLVGLFVGTTLGFLLDILWILKERWRRLIFGDLTRTPAGGRALHKVLE